MSLRVFLFESQEGTDPADAATFHDYEFNWIASDILQAGVIGVAAGTDLKVTQFSGGANMSVDVAAGKAVIEFTNSGGNGKTYKAVLQNTAVLTLAIATADPTNPRKDIVYAKIDGSINPDASSGNACSIAVATGTPAGSPTAPAVPAGSILLATIDIPASDTTIANAQITDGRTMVKMRTDVLADITRTADLASVSNGKGASLIGIEDAAGNFTATTVEAALTELAQGAAQPTIEVLVVGGGGGGGGIPANSGGAGGGGAGGVIHRPALAVPAGSYAITVGAGGAAGPGTQNVDGSVGKHSSFGNIIFALGGGAGGGGQSGTTIGGTQMNRNGASGGGAAYANAIPQGRSLGGGFDGGVTTGQGGSGGGGATAAGAATATAAGSNGGAGFASSISGASVTYGGGGGGGSWNSSGAGTGGAGGGGNGGNNADGSAGTANRGGGGGGGGGVAGSARAGGAGGSGVVIIRYPTASFGTCTGGTITTDGAYTIHTFTSSGTFGLVAL